MDESERRPADKALPNNERVLVRATSNVGAMEARPVLRRTTSTPAAVLPPVIAVHPEDTDDRPDTDARPAIILPKDRPPSMSFGKNVVVDFL